MKKLFIILILLPYFCVPCLAADLQAPSAPGDVSHLIPSNQEQFGQAIWYVISGAFKDVAPGISEAAGKCVILICASMLLSVLHGFDGMSQKVTEFGAVVILSCILLESTHSMIEIGTNTVHKLADYGKLLLPVMASALAAQGGIGTSAALYTATAAFSSLLSSMISAAVVPLIYVYLAMSIVSCAAGEATLLKLAELAKWFITKSMKIILYVFTGYITLSGVISGTTDQTVLKATKLTISGMIPMVGGILSDASEAVLVGAGVVKNSVGVYGLIAVIAIVAGPFLRIGAYYLLLKLTAAISTIFSQKNVAELTQHFSAAMGFALAMTGSVCLMLMISVVCFLRGVVT